ncbi:hypothetical protein SAMN04487905_1227 [Actinopolyspora xinjiangensis]|uniref:DUF6603 domain-containing protein n=1 Tax=Actinopolyspora xinjiangensis TaxID=405564 RepID=A0A1H0X1L4_9ACTN|nr:DUF6603 domain-containing protein [Actinopolyspora xinjiangensis]SDP96858.1 hypothetical protein SAMN04487905_1227 [Actinopolyspora xinjiangensis]
MLTVSQLKTRAETAQQNSKPLEVLAAEWDGTPLTTLFNQHFANGKLVLGNVRVTTTNAAITVTGAVSLPKMTASLTAEAVFTRNGEQIKGINLAVTLNAGNWSIDSGGFVASLDFLRKAGGTGAAAFCDKAFLLLWAGTGKAESDAAIAWAQVELSVFGKSVRLDLVRVGALYALTATSSQLGVPLNDGLKSLRRLPFVGTPENGETAWQLPSGLTPSGPKIQDIRIVVDSTKKTVRSAVVTVSLGVGWKVVDGHLEISQANASVSVLPKALGKSVISLSLTGTAVLPSLGHLAVDVAVSLPDLRLSGKFRANTPQPISGEAAARLTELGIAQPKSASGALWADLKRDRTSFGLWLALAGTWQLDLGGGKKITISDSGVEFHRRGGTWALAVRGVAAIDDKSLHFDASAQADKTVPWRLRGEVHGLAFSGFATWLKNQLDVDVPDAISRLALREVALVVEVTQQTRRAAFACAAEFPVGSAMGELAVTIGVGASKRSGAFNAGAVLTVERPDGERSMRLRGRVVKENDEVRFRVDWTVSRSGFSLAELAKLLGVELPAELAQLVPVINSACLVHRRDTKRKKSSLAFVLKTSKTETVFASVTHDTKSASALVAQAAVDLSMSALPVVGPQIPPGAARLRGIGAVRVSDLLKPNDPLRKALTAVLVNSRVTLPEAAWQAEVTVGLDVELAGKLQSFLIPFKSHPRELSGGQVEEYTSDGLEPADVVLAPRDVPERTDMPPTTVVWTKVDRTIGPLRMARVGLGYSTGTVWLLIDAAVSLGGVTFQAHGLGLGVGIKEPHPVTGALDGLGLAWSQGPVQVSGAVLRRAAPKPYTLMLAGGFTVRTPRIAVAAAGAYFDGPRGVSFFLFGEGTGLKIGTPPVFVEGLCGGFGYNSAVAVPAVDQIGDHPMVAGLTDPSKFPVKDGPLKILESLGRVVRPQPGEIWLAAGIDLTAFEFVKARILLALQFGSDFTLMMLGLATARFPKDPRGGSGAVVKPIAQLGLAVRALYRSSTGELSLSGGFTRDSYLLHPDCRVEGDFALCTWVGPSPHTGDFVVTFGGYHPKYRAPKHYPVARRIGVRWAVNAETQIRAAWYAALTPAAFMFGGELHVDFNASIAHAWLDAKLDALIQWQPFSFEVALGLRAGAELRKGFNPRVEVGVDLTVWGPPTGGVAVVHPPIGPDFHIRFGASDRPARARWLGWADFHDKALAKQQVRLVPTHGLLSEQRSTPGTQPEKWSLAQGGFTLELRAPTPITDAKVSTSVSQTTSLGLSNGGKAHIRPMGSTQLSATHTITLHRKTNGQDEVVNPVPVGGSKWTFEAIKLAVPASLWGEPLDKPSAVPDVGPGKELLLSRLVGVRMIAPPPKFGGTRGTVSPEDFGIKEITGDKPALPVKSGAAQKGPKPTRPGTVRTTLSTGLAGTLNDRSALHGVLKAHGLLPTGLADTAAALPDCAARAWSYLAADPMIVQTGQ